MLSSLATVIFYLHTILFTRGMNRMENTLVGNWLKKNKKQTQARQRLQSLTLKPVFVIIKRWTFISKEICRPRKPWGRIQYKYSWKNLARQKHSGISWMQLVPLSHTNASGALTNVNKNDLRCGGIFLYLHFVAKGSSNWLKTFTEAYAVTTMETFKFKHIDIIVKCKMFTTTTFSKVHTQK